MAKKIVYLLLAVSLGLNAGMIATTLVNRSAGGPRGSQPGPGGPDRPGGPGQRPDAGQLVDQHVGGMTRHLDLDAGQQQAIRAVMERHAPQLIELQVAAGVAGRRLAEMFAAPTFDPEEFRRLTAETSVARSRLDSFSAVMLVNEAAVLTPEQRRKFAEVAPSVHSGRQGPPGRKGPPGQGGPPPPR